MLMVPGVADADYSSLRIVVYGASPISEDVLAKCVEMFKPCKFWQAYGLTETTGAVVNLAPEGSRHDRSEPASSAVVRPAGPRRRDPHRR
jgi:long-chain acyl-CoA synthetase